MNRRDLLSPALVFSVLLIGCENTPDSGPGKVRWDRDSCQRCVMVVSEPNFAAQIRGGMPGEKQKLYKFDDLGCAVIWLDQQDWKDNPDNQIWVGHYQTGEWIDAEQAHFVKNQLSPMNYGLGAQQETSPGALTFAQAKEHIYKIEQALNLHGGTIHQASPAPSSTPAAKQ